ncbi:ribosomal protein S18-alanine N-acetyltransferase [Hydrogenophaga sp. T2]|uniref:ribosomal protein S18-alanine N-acetyltransferase n=1 Tax=Hydrogenophaga sp. T2 TaxID=3132823 RepID=UPI003CEFE456
MTTACADLPLPAQAAAGERAVRFAPMTEADLEAVHAIETRAYGHPWTRKHFRDSLQAGHRAVLLLGQVLPGEQPFPVRDDGLCLLGYLVAMRGVDEVHLLNITVAPAHQRQGWARVLMDALALWARGEGAHTLWLEVRQSNAPARRLYERCGFEAVGLRRAYYPLSGTQREDAIVMKLPLHGAEPQA